MNDNKPKTAKEAFERIGRMRDLVEQAQTALDQEVYNLKELMGSTFEHEGVRYQVRTPNVKRGDRKHNVVQHPFIVTLTTTPKEAKAIARMRKAQLTDEQVQENITTLLALKDTDLTPVEATTSEVVEEATLAVAALVRDDDTDDTTSEDSPEETFQQDVIAAGIEDDSEDDIVIE